MGNNRNNSTRVLILKFFIFYSKIFWEINPEFGMRRKLPQVYITKNSLILTPVNTVVIFFSVKSQVMKFRLNRYMIFLFQFGSHTKFGLHLHKSFPYWQDSNYIIKRFFNGFNPFNNSFIKIRSIQQSVAPLYDCIPYRFQVDCSV